MGADSVDVIISALKKLLATGGDDGFVIFNDPTHPQHYVQFTQASAGNLYGEAVSNAFLPPDDHLDAQQDARMLALGWKAPVQGSENYFDRWSVSSDEVLLEVAMRVMRTFEEVFHHSMDTPLEVELEC